MWWFLSTTKWPILVECPMTTTVSPLCKITSEHPISIWVKKINKSVEYWIGFYFELGRISIYLENSLSLFWFAEMWSFYFRQLCKFSLVVQVEASPEIASSKIVMIFPHLQSVWVTDFDNFRLLQQRTKTLLSRCTNIEFVQVYHKDLNNSVIAN